MRPRARPRVFLDSNVIFSGLYSPEGAPGAILEQFVEGRLEVVVSQQVLEEVVLTIKKKLPEALPALRTLLLNTPPEVIKDVTVEKAARWSELINRDDAFILAAAVEAQPDFLITGDQHFLKDPEIAEDSGLKIISPAAFIEHLA